MEIKSRKFDPRVAHQLMVGGLDPLLSRLYASRGVRGVAEVSPARAKLIPYDQLAECRTLASILADCVENQKRILIVADYDADGATACTVAWRGLTALGANVGYIIPERLTHGYGLGKGIAKIACAALPRPDYLLTVDCGIASHEGIDEANRLGVPVLVTDHHLPAATRPAVVAMVNPNQPGCTFPSKALAGCGVIWYVLWALQDELIERGIDFRQPYFDIDSLLPIVAIGTVADVVALDENNRTLVHEGLERIRRGDSFPGIDALAKVAGKDPRSLATSDIAFGVAPRINAAGRLGTMDAGVECLTTDDLATAEALAVGLNEMNAERQGIEAEIAKEAAEQLLKDVKLDRFTAVLHSAGWHPGVIGIVAGRIKERVWRPTFVLAEGPGGELKGSGRSIPGFHLRDILDRIDRVAPGLLPKFGGHAMAAGVTVRAGGFTQFAELFEQMAKEVLSPDQLLQVLDVDGPLDEHEMTLATVAVLKAKVWGQAFPEPVFYDQFEVVNSRSIGEGKHLSFDLGKGRRLFKAVKFRCTSAPPRPGTVLNVAYKLDANAYQGKTNVQLLVEHFEAVQ